MNRRERRRSGCRGRETCTECGQARGRLDDWRVLVLQGGQMLAAGHLVCVDAVVEHLEARGAHYLGDIEVDGYGFQGDQAS